MRHFGAIEPDSAMDMLNNVAQRKEVRLILPPARTMGNDPETRQLMEDLAKGPQVELLLEKNESRHFLYADPDNPNHISWHEAVNLNCVQWFIPVGVKTKVPKPIYDILMQSPHNKDLMPSIPQPGQWLHAGKYSRL